ncbi:MAG: N-formylglutamate amidohydrolase [Pseudomonadota bacterium]
MKLPLLLSVPHAGLSVPAEVGSLCILKRSDIIEDGDEGAEAICYPLKGRVSAFVTTHVARAVVDVNRDVNDRGKDGAVKTHTCWDVPVYRTAPSGELVQELLGKYYKPYHDAIAGNMGGAMLGVDCHTMAREGPPVGPDPGRRRPAVCLSNAGFTCSDEWLASMAECFEAAFNREILLNNPFKGGFIIRSHAGAVPWIQVELSREPFLADEEKSRRVLQALTDWCGKNS